jgi:hypothetical protein
LRLKRNENPFSLGKTEHRYLRSASYTQAAATIAADGRIACSQRSIQSRRRGFLELFEISKILFSLGKRESTRPQKIHVTASGMLAIRPMSFQKRLQHA